MERINGKVVRLCKSGLFFIMGRDKQKYVGHTKETDSKIKEGCYVYFFPEQPQPIFDDGDIGKYLYARDVKRYSDLSPEEKERFNPNQYSQREAGGNA